MKVLIRADASSQIGVGHVMRCLTLANALHQQGIECIFVCRELPGHIIDKVLAAGHYYISLAEQYPESTTLDWQLEVTELTAKIASNFDWLIVDHYGLDARWESAMRPYVQRIMVIDDLCNRPHDADVLLDQNLSANLAAYQQWVSPSCALLLGPKYALLRPEFTGQAIQIKPKVERILVNFGGADPTRELFKVMDALQDLHEIHVDFVAGISNPAWAELQQSALHQANWYLLQHCEDFAELMRQADVFIGAVGGTSWERAALGLPSICISVAENQEFNAQSLQCLGAHFYLGASSGVSSSAIEQQLASITLSERQYCSGIASNLVDGLGVRRASKALLQADLQVREVVFSDAHLLFTARNALEVRLASLQQKELVWDAHCDWLQARLANPQSLLLLGEVMNEVVGVVRFDFVGIETAEVSIYLMPGHYRLGWGSILLKLAEIYMGTFWPHITQIRAQIKDDNLASLALFASSGYVGDGSFYLRPIKEIQA